MKYALILCVLLYVYWIWRELKNAPDDPQDPGNKV